MCLNRKWIFNKYINQKLLVDCGKCDTCQHDKANRLMTKIHNTFGSQYDCFFVTLTYKNEYCPYIKRSELDCFPLNIYRDSSKTHYMSTKNNQKILKSRINPSTQIIDTIDLEFNGESFDIEKIPHLNKYDFDKIGVCYYKDLQNYLKRFRQILKRKYNFNDKFLYLSVSEYGKTSSRPHFHLLMFFPKGYYEVAKFSSFAAWSFDDYYRKQESFQFAKKPAKYVSGYICKSVNLSEFFTVKGIRQKHSFSIGFGSTAYRFSLSSLKAKIQENNLTFNVLCTSGINAGRVSTVLFPKYIALRYFPRFKGFCSCSDSQIFEYITQPFRVWDYKEKCFLDDLQFHQFKTKVANVVAQYFDGNYYDYAFYYIRFWNLYRSTSLKLYWDQFDGNLNNIYQMYDNSFGNIGLIRNSENKPIYKSSLSLVGLNDPNNYPLLVKKDFDKVAKFKDYMHHMEQISVIHNV